MEILEQINKISLIIIVVIASLIGCSKKPDNTPPTPIAAFTFNNDGAFSQAYDGVWVMIKGNCGNGGWSGLRTRSSFVSLFDANPNDYRGYFAKEDKGQEREIAAPNNSQHGYGVFKFRNVKIEWQ